MIEKTKIIDEIHGFLIEGKINEAIKKFIEVSRNTDFYARIMAINASFIEYQENKTSGIDVKGEFAKTTKILTETLTEFEKSVLNIPKSYNEESHHYDQDEVYALLCKLNFDHETTYFHSLINTNLYFLSFIVRGKENYHGQEWLHKKLIHHYKQKFRNVDSNREIDLHGVDFDTFLNELAKSFDIDITKKDKDIKIKNVINDILKTQSLVITVKNAYDLIHSSDGYKFINAFEYFFREIKGTEPKNKCILFLIEHQNCSNYEEKEYYLSSHCIHELDAEGICEDFKLVDLSYLKSIDADDINNWLKHCSTEKRESFKDIRKDVTQMQTFLGDGNPLYVIPKVCSIIGVNYEELKQKYKINHYA